MLIQFELTMLMDYEFLIDKLMSIPLYIGTVFQFLVEKISPLLNNLDPSLFQNIIIGILMILIFIGEQIFSEVKTQDKRGEFSKMVIFYEILNITWTAVIAVLSIFLIAFFKDNIDGDQIHSISNEVKLIVSILVIFISFLLIKPIFKFQVFFRGKRHRFEVSFLKSLNFSKILKFRNHAKGEKMVRAWNSFWQEKTEFREIEFIEIFIDHIDQALKYEKFQLVIDLAQTYLNTLEKRERIWIGANIWSKTLEWSELLWEQELLWLNNHKKKKTTLKYLPAKYLPTFRRAVEYFYRKARHTRFWNWNYFQKNYFKVIIVKLLRADDSYYLFDAFKKHIEKCSLKMKKLRKDKNQTEKYQRYQRYLEGLFQSFCPIFFENVGKNNGIWEESFPSEWLITISGIDSKDNPVPRVFLLQFLKWMEGKIKNKQEKDTWDTELSNVEYSLFPEVDPALFAEFLVLLYSQDIESLVKKFPNFGMSRIRSYHGTIGEKTQEEISGIWKQQIEEEEENTFKMILKIIKIVPFESREWVDDSTMQISKGGHPFFKKESLKKFKQELKSKKIIALCKENEKYEYRRKKLIDLADRISSYLEE